MGSTKSRGLTVTSSPKLAESGLTVTEASRSKVSTSLEKRGLPASESTAQMWLTGPGSNSSWWTVKVTVNLSSLPTEAVPRDSESEFVTRAMQLAGAVSATSTNTSAPVPLLKPVPVTVISLPRPASSSLRLILALVSSAGSSIAPSPSRSAIRVTWGPSLGSSLTPRTEYPALCVPASVGFLMPEALVKTRFRSAQPPARCSRCSRRCSCRG